jgi:hypothetical protein
MGGGHPLRGVLCAALVIACGGCKSSSRPEPSPYLRQTSPENVLANLQTAYRARDIDAYSAQLAADFRFEFAPDDLGDTGIPPDGTFTFVQDSLSTRNMFTNEFIEREEDRVLDVRIRLQYGNAVADTLPGHEGWRYILIQNTFLEVEQQGSTDTGTITLQVNGAQADFYFRRGRDAEDDSGLWYVVNWRDRPFLYPGAGEMFGTSPGAPVSSAIEGTTWGAIKAIYYPGELPASPIALRGASQ